MQFRRLVVFASGFLSYLRAGELRKNGIKLKLSGQPFQVLTILLARPGEVVTWEELQNQLWPDTFVNAERNLNTVVNTIREVLGDSAENPQVSRDVATERVPLYCTAHWHYG